MQGLADPSIALFARKRAPLHACLRLLETLPLHDEASLERFFGAALLRNAADHARALAEIAALMGAPAGSEQADRLEVLSVLAGAYETGQKSTVDCDPVDALTVAMQAQGRSQAELAQVLGSRSRASEVLKRRLLSAEMIERIARAWAIPASLLAAPYEVGRSFRAPSCRRAS